MTDADAPALAAAPERPDFDKLTEAADLLMGMGFTTVYQEKREQIERRLHAMMAAQ
jgi:hypothetical protein